MSNRIGVRLAAIVVVLFALLGLAAVAVSAQSPPTPKPSLTIQKVGEATGSEVVYFTITVTNVGNSQTDQSVLVQDALSADAYWFLLGAQQSDGDDSVNATDACKLVPGTPAGAQLVCQITDPLLGRHLNEDEDDFVYGSFTVHVYGIARKCGPVTNTAWFLYGTQIKSSTAEVAVPCPATPTPTATPTQPPPTQTPIPPTATPVIVVITATPTATPTQRVAPLPPNTGDSTLTHDSSRIGDPGASWIYGGLILAGLAFTIGGVAAARRGRR